MTEPGGGSAGTAGGRGRLRASHADRERVIEVLKAAFVQGRLDHNELDARVGQALASRTYAELAALTADIPADPTPRMSARPQNQTSRGRPIRNGAILSGASLSMAAVAILSAFILPEAAAPTLLVLAAFIVIAVVPAIMMVALATAWEQRRSRGKVPPRPGPGGQAREVRQPGHDPALPGDRPDQAGAEFRSGRSRAGRPHCRSIRPAGASCAV